MVVLVNRAKMTTSTTGTGTITLGSVVDGYQTFAAAGVSNGDSVRYVIEDGTSNWEIGSGTYTASGTTLSRTPSESSGGGSAIDLSGDAIVFISAIASDIQPVTYVTTTFTATAAQTTFTVSYTVGLVEVFLNGAKLSGADFTATNGTSIVLASGANAGDTVDVIAYGTVSVANTYTQAQADAKFVDVAGDTMTGDLTVTGEVVADELIIAGVSNSFSSNAGNGTIITTNNGGSYPFNESGSLLYRPRQNDTDGRGNHYFYTGATPKLRQNITPNGDIGFYEDTGTTPKFFWDASAESLGIGTSSPSALLHLESAGPSIKLVDSDNNPDYEIKNGNGSFRIIDTTAGSDRINIDSSGNVLVGKTSTSSNVAGHRLNPRGDIESTRSGGLVAYLNRQSSDGDIAVFAKDGTTVGSIGSSSIGGLEITGNNSSRSLLLTTNFFPANGSGAKNDGAIDLGISDARWKDLYLSGTANAANFNTTSDATLKTNVETLSGSLDAVTSLRGVSFDWLENGDSEIGVIAQEVEAVLPNLVSTNDQGIKSVKYGNMVAVLIEAIKEQQEQIDELKAQLNS